jgi:tight adherence protein B
MNPNLIYVYGAAGALTAFVLFLLGRYIWDLRTRRLAQRLEDTGAADDSVVLRRQRPKGWTERMDQAFHDLVMQTGLDLKPDQAVAWMILIGGILAIAAYLVREEVWLAPIGFVAGAGIVLASFFIYRSIYRTKLQDLLPDAIFLLARSLRAGMSLEQALALIGNEGVEPLASEFKRCDSQIKLGLPIVAALENMARRLQTIDFNALVSTVTVFQTMGGNLPMLLDRLASSARDRTNFRSYFRTATALARISIIPVALAVPVIIIAYIGWQPDYVKGFLDTPNGPLFIGLAIAAELVGLFWIYRLLQFDY